MYNSSMLTIVGVLLMATFSVGAQEGVPDGQIRKIFVKLTDYLDAKLPDNDDPEANLDLVRKYSSGAKLFGKEDLSIAVGLFKTIAKSDPCDSSLFEALTIVEDTTQARFSETERRADKVLRKYAIDSVKKCDSFHENALKEALAEVPSGDRTKIESVISDEFIEAYKTNLVSYLPQELTFNFRSIHMGFNTHPLTKSIWTVAKDDPRNTLTLRTSIKEREERSVDKNTVKYLFDTYFLAPCHSYYDAVNPIFEYGKVSSVFFKNGESQFLEKRSKDYRDALIRRHLCYRLVSDTDKAISDGVTDFQFHL